MCTVRHHVRHRHMAETREQGRAVKPPSSAGDMATTPTRPQGGREHGNYAVTSDPPWTTTSRGPPASVPLLDEHARRSASHLAGCMGCVPWGKLRVTLQRRRLTGFVCASVQQALAENTAAAAFQSWHRSVSTGRHLTASGLLEFLFNKQARRCVLPKKRERENKGSNSPFQIPSQTHTRTRAMHMSAHATNLSTTDRNTKHTT